jgi:hypothetical protein
LLICQNVPKWQPIQVAGVLRKVATIIAKNKKLQVDPKQSQRKLPA